MRRVLGVVALSAALAVSWCRPAQACGPCLCDDQPSDIITLIRGLPLNLQIPLPLLEENEPPPWLERADGTQVAATVERRDAMAAWWLAVEQDLEPNTDYQVVRESGIAALFTTGSARDEAPPTLTAMEARGGGNEALCGSSFGGVLSLSGVADAGESFNVWLELEVVAGSMPRLIYAPLGSANVALPLGSSAMGCFGRLELPELAGGGSVALGARLFDAAGNVSELRTTVLQAEASEPGGCEAPSNSAGAGPSEPSGGGTASQAGNTGNPAEPDDDATRTSKGCGCSVPGSPRARFSALVPAALLLAFRRRARNLTP